MSSLLYAADIFVDRDILRFAGAEAVSDLEGDVIAGFLNVDPPPASKIAKLLREGQYGEIGDLMAETWGAQFRGALTEAIAGQIQRAGDRAATNLGKDGFGVEEMITAAVEASAGVHVHPLPVDTVVKAHPGEKVDIIPLKQAGEARTIIVKGHVDASMYPPSVLTYSRLQKGGAENLAYQFAALAAPSFDPSDPAIDAWINTRVSSVVGSLEDDARATIADAIKRGAADQLTDKKVALLIRQHIGLDPRRAAAVDNYRKWLDEFRSRRDIERVIKTQPRTVKERLQRGGWKRKEWRIIREQGIKGPQDVISDKRRDVMVREYADRLKKERALGIAQTEINTAQNKGKELAWAEAEAKGALVPGAKRKWVTRGDDKVCKLCRPMAGQLADIGGIWETAIGAVNTPNEIHTRCRCTEELIAEPARPTRKRGARTKFGLEMDALIGAKGIDNEEHTKRVGARFQKQVEKRTKRITRDLQKRNLAIMNKKQGLRRAIDAAYGASLGKADLGKRLEKLLIAHAKLDLKQRKINAALDLPTMRAKEVRRLVKQIRPVGGGQSYARGFVEKNESAINAALKYYPRDWVDASEAFGPIQALKEGLTGEPLRGYYQHLPTAPLSLGSTEAMKAAGWTADQIAAKQAHAAFHALGHRFEQIVPDLKTLQKAFLARRKGTSISTSIPGYGSDELFFAADFVNPYIGADYKGDGFEIVSMGFEEVLGGNSAGRNVGGTMWEDDPDMLRFILGLLVGAK